jgi:hypothetical protein
MKDPMTTFLKISDGTELLNADHIGAGIRKGRV